MEEKQRMKEVCEMKQKNKIKQIAALLFLVLSLTVLPVITSAAVIPTADILEVTGATVRYADANGATTGDQAQGLRFAVTVDKFSRTYLNAVKEEGYYTADNATTKFGIVIIPTDLIPDGEELSKDTPDAEVVIFDKIYAQNDDEITFTASLLGIPTEDYTRGFTARAFMKVTRSGEDRYSYSEEALSRTFVGVGNIFYEENRENETLCARVDEIFASCDAYQGVNLKSVTFTLFSDLHYWEGWYIATVGDLETILKRADQSDSDFVIQAGDFTNHVGGSPELFNAYLKNKYDLPAYGVYGNHELEGGDGMNTVTPTLTNRPDEVVWGTENGKIAADGSIGYYYFDVNGIRMICLDTNYSFNPTTHEWEHSRKGSYSYPAGNQKGYSLGPTQLAWLEEVLNDAAENDTSCVVLSHHGFARSWYSSPDGDAVRALYKEANEKNPGTVLMSINGHLHTNRTEVVDNVLHFDMNTVRNGVYTDNGTDHYTDQTFTFERYDANGKLISSASKPIKDLGHAKRSWFFKDPLSAVITVSTSGKITIEGSKTEWLGGVAPTNPGSGVMPEVTNGVFVLQVY